MVTSRQIPVGHPHLGYRLSVRIVSTSFNWDAEERYGILLYNRAGTRDQQNKAIEHLKHAAEMSSIAENALKQLGI